MEMRKRNTMTELVDNNPSPLLLVVDDDMAERVMAREVLGQAGFRVEEVDDGLLALSAFDQVHPDLVLLDVMMPAIDGFTTCCQIREMPRGEHIPILMMTGLDDMGSINRAYQVGATDFITKPINYMLLTHRIRYMLRAKRIQDELRASEARLANAQRIAKIGHWEWELGSDRIHWSHEIVRICGLPSSETTGTYRCFLDLVYPEDRKEVDTIIRKAVCDQRGYSMEHRILRPDGALRFVHQEAEFSINGPGGTTRLVGTIQDVTERKHIEQQIHHLAYYNEVTGLPNRIMLKRQLAEMLTAAKRDGCIIAVLTLDLDYFTRINDTLGHNMGNELLQEVARRLAGCPRHSGSIVWKGAHGMAPPVVEGGGNNIAHLGGDEFVLLADIRDVEDAAVVARYLSDTLARPFLLQGNEVLISASVGISIYPDDGHDAEILLKQSGAALTHAKCEGRNCHKFYTASMNARAFKRFSMETNLRKALKQDQFQLHYQPKIEAKGTRVAGMETLVRWEHPELGLVPPTDFIPIAEETGFIIPLSEWILYEACEQIMAWQSKGLPPLRVSVNLSAAQFRQRDLPLALASIFRETGVDPQMLELEITEGLLMDNVESNIAILNQLKELGLEISVDDFGIGYSSLSYLKRFPINALKIDQSFIREVTHDLDDAAIVRAIVALAHNLRLKVIAEGVEHEHQLNFLREIGCDEVQGYYFSRPLPAEAFAEWLLARQTIVRIHAVG